MNSSVTQHIVGVDGNPIKVKGSVVVPPSIANLTFKQEFIVAKGITAEGILGLDFLEANKCILNLTNREVTVGSRGIIPLSTHPSQKPEKASTVSLVETLRIPAVNEIEVMGKIHTSTTDSMWLVEGNKQTSVLVARAAVRPNNSLIPLRLVNSSLAPVTVYKGAKIATAELIHDNNICVVMSPSKESNVVNKIDLAHPLPEDLSQSEREKFLALLSNYVDILATNSNDLGQTDVLNHHIDIYGKCSTYSSVS